MFSLSPILKPKIIFSVAVTAALLFIIFQLNNNETVYSIAVVEKGEVISTIGVSGYIEAPKIAKLTFPTTGVVTAVFTKRGDFVQTGTVLATLGSATQVAERNQATAQLAAAEANRDLIKKGARGEAVSLAEANVSAAEAALEKLLDENESRIKNARSILNSTQLEALSTDSSEKTTAPQVTGTYTCEEEGEYKIKVYSSKSDSGYSYQYFGLEEGTDSVTTKQPSALGNCGLFLQFSADMQYSSSEWIISIPNKRASAYPANNAALLNAIASADTALSAASKALTTAQMQSGLNTAPALSEELRKAEALVSEARARVLSIDSTLADRSIMAPFDGIVTDVEVVIGEVASQQPLITLLAQEEFELVVRIPEIDSTKVLLGQKAQATFDAAAEETLEGEVVYISPLATEIDGVAYFETRVLLTETPDWVRSGLNADVDIILEEKQDVLRLPRRFVVETPVGSYVNLISPKGVLSTSSISIGVIGSNGYIEVTSLSEGTEIIAP